MWNQWYKHDSHDQADHKLDVQKNISLLSADDNTSKTGVCRVLLPLICWVILKFGQSIGMPIFQPWHHGGFSHDFPKSEMWGICSSRSGRTSSSFQSWSMIQAPGFWASRQDSTGGSAQILGVTWGVSWNRLENVTEKIPKSVVSALRVSHFGWFWGPPLQETTCHCATQTSWKWLSTRSPDF